MKLMLLIKDGHRSCFDQIQHGRAVKRRPILSNTDETCIIKAMQSTKSRSTKRRLTTKTPRCRDTGRSLMIRDSSLRGIMHEQTQNDTDSRSSPSILPQCRNDLYGFALGFLIGFLDGTEPTTQDEYYGPADVQSSSKWRSVDVGPLDSPCSTQFEIILTN